MNDLPKQIDDPATRAAPVSAATDDSQESWVSERAAALWRRRLRTYQAPRAWSNDGGNQASEHQATTDSVAIGSLSASSSASSESQQAGLAAMIRLSEAAPSGLPPIARSHAPQLEGSAPQRDLPANSLAARPVPTMPLTTAVLDRPTISAPQVLVAPVDSPDGTGVEAGREQRGTRDSRRFALMPGIFLIVILAVQAALSLRLIWSNTAFLDEATYLFGGHVEIAHWLHGTAIPAFPTYFSGTPVIYPPLAALAAAVGGLAAARLLSLAFMLGATALLWSTASKLFGSLASVFAATLFAVLGPTQALGAFATYDAMALFLLAASTWCIVSAQDRNDSTLLLLAGTLLLALANATKYATALFDPVIVTLAVITITRRRGFKAGLARGGYISAGTLGLISVLLALGGSWYLTGVLSTTLSRADGNKPAFLVLTDAWKWSGLVCVIAGIGVVFALRRHDRVQLMIVTVLAASGTLVPLDQARIHTTTSLFKQVDFGAWFTAAAAAFALVQLSGIRRRTWLRVGATFLVGTLAVAFAVIIGRAQASGFFQDWPNSTQETAALRSLTQSHPGTYLAEDYNVPAYYLERSIPWQRWAKTWYFSYESPHNHVLSGAAAYRAAIDDGYFSLVILNFTDTVAADSGIVAYMRRARTYQLVAVIPTSDNLGSGQVMVWEYEPLTAPQEGHHGNR